METENGATVQKLLEKSPVSVKKIGIYCLKLRKRKVKNQKFSKITRVDKPEASVESSEQAKPEKLTNYTQAFIQALLAVAVFGIKMSAVSPVSFAIRASKFMTDAI